MSNMTYSEIVAGMNPKYRQTILDRREAEAGIAASEPLTGEQVVMFGCDLWFNPDFFLEVAEA